MANRPIGASKTRKTAAVGRKQLPAGKTPAKSLMAAKKRPSEGGTNHHPSNCCRRC